MKQKVIVIDDIDQSDIEKKIDPLLEDGWLIFDTVAEQVSSGQSYSRSGSIIFILEKES